jgi:hypothetical protein
MSNEGKIKCRWCGEFFDEGDVSIELNMGPLCDDCVDELESRGERPVIAYGMSYDEWREEKKKKRK